jgi:hypothetical protein
VLELRPLHAGDAPAVLSLLAGRLALGHERRAEIGSHRAGRRVLVGGRVRRVDERHRGLDERPHAGLDPSVDEHAHRVRAQPVVLPPRLGMVELLPGRDPGGQMQDRVAAAHRMPD